MSNLDSPEFRKFFEVLTQGMITRPGQEDDEVTLATLGAQADELPPYTYGEVHLDDLTDLDSPVPGFRRGNRVVFGNNPQVYVVDCIDRRNGKVRITCSTTINGCEVVRMWPLQECDKAGMRLAPEESNG